MKAINIRPNYDQSTWHQKFYEGLDNLTESTPKTDKLIILVDFNACIGSDNYTSGGTIIKCLIAYTILCLPKWKWTLWMHSWPKHWHFIDYAMVRDWSRKDSCVTERLCGANCTTGHWLIWISKIKITIKPPRWPKGEKKCKHRMSQIAGYHSTISEENQHLSEHHWEQWRQHKGQMGSHPGLCHEHIKPNQMQTPRMIWWKDAYFSGCSRVQKKNQWPSHQVDWRLPQCIFCRHQIWEHTLERVKRSSARTHSNLPNKHEHWQTMQS